MRRALLLTLPLLACGRTPAILGPDPYVQQQPLVGCEGRALVMLDDRRTLTRVTAGGVTPLYTFGEGSTDKTLSLSQWDSVNGFTFGAALVEVKGPNAYTWEYALLGPDGKVRFSTRRAERYSPRVHFGDDGWLAVAGDTGWLLSPEGEVTELGELIPMTPRLPSGEVVVARGKPWDEASPKGVWKDGVFRPVDVPVHPDLHVVEGRVWLQRGAELVSLLDGARIALPSAELQWASQAGHRVLLASAGAAAVADLEAGTASPLANAPADAARYGLWSAALAEDGTVLASASHGELLQLERSDDLGATWSAVGDPMPPGEDFGLGSWLYAVPRARSVLTLAISTGYGHYVNGLQLVSPRGVQRLETGLVYVNTTLPGSADLSADGECAAAWVRQGDERESRLVLLDADGARREVLSGGGPFELGWFRFLP